MQNKILGQAWVFNRKMALLTVLTWFLVTESKSSNVSGAFLRPEFAQYFASSPFGRASNPLLRNKIIFPTATTLQQQQQQHGADLYLNGQDKVSPPGNEITSIKNSD